MQRSLSSRKLVVAALLVAAWAIALYLVFSGPTGNIFAQYTYAGQDAAGPRRVSVCTSSGLSANCLFENTMCLETASAQRPRNWSMDMEPSPGWGGVQQAVKRMGGDEFGDWSGCDHPFKPHLSDAPLQGVVIPGTTLYVCTWINQFGHNLLDVTYPAFEALRAFGRLDTGTVDDGGDGARHGQGWGSRVAGPPAAGPDAVSILLDSHLKTETGGSLATTVDLLRLLAPVSGAKGLAAWAMRTRQPRVCFERLIVGFRRQGLDPNDEVPRGGYQAMRDHVLQRHGMAPLQLWLGGGGGDGGGGGGDGGGEGGGAPAPCAALVVRRRGTRVLLNEAAVVAALTKELGRRCPVKVTELAGRAARQVAALARTTWLVSVSGSGSHQMVWLPDGAVSVVIESPYHRDVNRRTVCPSSESRVLCLTVGSGAPAEPSASAAERMAANATAALPELVERLREGVAWQRRWARDGGKGSSAADGGGGG